jgi:hypothetical protein
MCIRDSPSAVALAAAFVLSAAEAAEAADASLSFVVIGDAPYGPEDEAMLAAALPRIRAMNPPFVIHLGDYKGGRAPCTTAADDRFARLVEDLAPIPVFYTPGDNEWTDCDRHIEPATGRPASELARRDAVIARFHSGPAPGGAALAARRQPGRPENLAWTSAGVRLASVHVTGTENGRSFVNGDAPAQAGLEADARDADNAKWIAEAAADAARDVARALIIAMQGDPTEGGNARRACIGASAALMKCDAFLGLRAAFADAARTYPGPVLVIHGDTWPFTLDRAWPGKTPANLWRLNAAGDAGTGPTPPGRVRDVTFVRLTEDPARPFAAEGLTTGAKPRAKGR